MKRIAIISQGLFHGPDLARALTDLGHSVHYFTLARESEIRSVTGSGPLVVQCRTLQPISLILRAWRRWAPSMAPRLQDSLLTAVLQQFGSWAERKLTGSEWDITYSWSSISLPILKSARLNVGARLLVRGSTHIEHQYSILQQLATGTSATTTLPSRRIRQIECTEYDLADSVVTLSSFCHESFVLQGHPEARLILMRAGVNSDQFTPPPAKEQAETSSKVRSTPLRVLAAGSFSIRKGAETILFAADRLKSERVSFTFVGNTEKSAGSLRHRAEGLVQFLPRVSRPELAHIFQSFDLFFFPSHEEGLPQTLAQAAASGLPLVASWESGVQDLIDRGARAIGFNSMDYEEAVRSLELALSRTRDSAWRIDHDVSPRTWREAAMELLAACQALQESHSAADYEGN